ncbi:MAG: hypothetical protein K6A28_03300 [Bacteroidales bacterium]|nr:hypothetical protein [Bacteroidales bacterium]
MKRITLITAALFAVSFSFAQSNVGSSTTKHTDVYGNTTTIHMDGYGDEDGRTVSKHTDASGNTTTIFMDGYGQSLGLSTTGHQAAIRNTTVFRKKNRGYRRPAPDHTLVISNTGPNDSYGNTLILHKGGHGHGPSRHGHRRGTPPTIKHKSFTQKGHAR